MDSGALPPHGVFRVRDGLVQKLSMGWGGHSGQGSKTGSAHLGVEKPCLLPFRKNLIYRQIPE